ncbi:MAG: TetR/AcrR family transcriptional regulator [Sandaracinaceae bacterium]|nr:TetR/AcrR family transcriptional regulator [Sandaracinaceae bacterium]
MKSDAKQAARARRKPRARFHHGDLRAATLEVATRVVDGGGAEAVSVREIARALGVSDPAIYRHFDSREALLREVGLEGLGRAMAEVTAALAAADSPEARLCAAGCGYLRYAVAHPHWFRLFASRGFQDEVWPRPSAGPNAKVDPDDVPEPFRTAVHAEHAMKDALGVLVPEDEVDDQYRILWALAHGLAGLVVERLFRRVETDAERLTVAERAIALQVETLRRAARAR